MPVLDDLITGFVPGNHLSITRPVSNIPSGDSLAESWMTVKLDPLRDSDAEAVTGPKHITPSNNNGVGQITDTGAGDTEGAVRFDFSPAETLEWDPRNTYTFEIKHLTVNGFTYSSHVGTIRAPVRQVART